MLLYRWIGWGGGFGFFFSVMWVKRLCLYGGYLLMVRGFIQIFFNGANY